MKFQCLPGFRDFFPERMALRRAIERAWHVAARAAGFLEFEGPVLEPLELYTAKSGDEVVKQLYAFEDQGGRQVAMRPEMTPTLARMIAARAGALPKPIKWYCVPQFFRYERPQRGRGREFVQWNVDVIGAREAAADAEVIAVALDGLARLGLGPEDVVVRINDRRLLARMLDRLEVEEALREQVLAALDKIERDRKAKVALEELLGEERARALFDHCERFPHEQAEELAEVLEVCGEFGLSGYLEPDFRIVRGLAYYTGVVWEIFARRERLRAIAGGGRYDRLIAQLGGPDLPALGFGMGDMVLMELLEALGRLPEIPPALEVYVVPIGEAMTAPARRLLAELRRRDVAADMPYRPLKVGKALKAATRCGARHAVILGEQEWNEGRLRLKDLESGEERTLEREALFDVL